MLIELLILLFTIIIFYEIFNDLFLDTFIRYESFATNSDAQKKSISDINTSLAKLSDNINALNQKIKEKTNVGLEKYNEVTEGQEVDINNTENI
jgi:hypothetical protein